MSFLSVIGKDVKGVFAWLGSSKGQATVSALEVGAVAIGTAVGIGPAVQQAETLVNTWMQEAIKTEALAEAAGQQTSSTAKASVALSTMVPQLTAFLAGQNLTSQQTSDKANTINTAIVTILNALEAPATVTATPATT